MSGGLKNWFFALNIREKYFCLLSYLEKLERNMKNGFFLCEKKHLCHSTENCRNLNLSSVFLSFFRETGYSIADGLS